MKLGRRYEPQEIVFSLEKPTPSSSSSSSPASSSSSSSTSAGCGPFNFILNTTLGSNLDFPDQYFGEAVGVNIISPTQVVLSYDNFDIAGPAFIMNIQIGSQIVASAGVAFGLDTRLYFGKPFSLTYLGVTYCGTFASGTVILG